MEGNMKDKCFDELYTYVKKEIMKYDINQALPSDFVLKLKGLSQGTYIVNQHNQAKANYSYEVVLATFKLCRVEIERAIENTDIKDENHKMNLVLKIVRKNINDVYLKFKRKQKQETKLNQLDLNIDKGAGYRKKSNDIINNKLKDLW